MIVRATSAGTGRERGGSMVSVDVRNAHVDFPIFDAKTRSLKKQVLGKIIDTYKNRV
jgi:hypothetical protein